VKNIRSSKITNAARGAVCTLRIVGACNYDQATTVAAHLPDQSHGIGLKGHDLFVVFACSCCHDVIDGRRKWPEYEGDRRDWYLLRALKHTLLKLHETGVLRIA
jgi:hypothetical protein